MSDARCSELSLAAGERLAATASRAERWLVLEVPGTWPRDVAAGDGLSERAAAAVAAWAARTPLSRVLFVRRPGRPAGALRAFAVLAEESAREVRRIELSHHDDLARLDLDTAGERVDASLVLVCGHGSRDACCALRGTSAFGALERRLGREELWISSHQGGHRFAANVLVLPAGLQFGRVAAGDAPFLVARALAGRIELDRYRGRTCFDPAVQAAEHAVREASGLDGVDELRLAGVEGSLVRFRSRWGATHTAKVEPAEGPAVPASCGAPPEPQPVFRAEVV